MRRALLLCAAPLFGCNQCEAPPPPTAGNIDRPGDVVVVVPPGEERALAFVSNPEIEQLRVFDVSRLPEGGFVPAPNVFFPLSVRTGPGTTDLSAPRGLPSRVLALDSANDEVYVVRTVDDDGGAAFTRVGAPIPTTGEPAAMDAALLGEDLVAFVALPDDGAVEAIAIDPDTGEERGRATLPLAAGARPTDVAVDPTGGAVLLADAVKSFVSIVDLQGFDVDAFADVAPRAIDVGGPTRRIAVGRVPLPDGMAPVAVALRRDAAEIAAIRLFREGFREERYALLGRAEVPGFPTAAYVPDQATSTTSAPPVVCCQGMSDDVVEAGEATAAWAAVADAEGLLYYVALAAPPAGGGAPQVRLIDVDLDPAGFDPEIDVNTTPELWVVPEGVASSPRPTVVATPVDNFGAPPVVPLVPFGAQLILVWEGPTPGLEGVPATFDDGALALDTANALEDLDVRTGDLVDLVLDDPTPGCEAELRTEVVAVGDASIDVRTGVGATGLSDDEVACIEAAGGLTATVRAGDAFVVDSTDRGPLGRLRFAEGAGGDDPPPETFLDLPGVRITLQQNPQGEPATGSILGLPLHPEVLTVGIPLSRDPIDDLGGFGDLARQPIAMAGGEMKVPSGDDDDALVDARRILMITPSRLFSFDEGETDVRQVASYR